MSYKQTYLILIIWVFLMPMALCQPQYEETLEEEEYIEPTDIAFGFGLTGGWGSTYGFGLEFSMLFTHQFDINGGIGFSTNGFKYGLGGRIFLLRDRLWSPYIGMNYVRSTGLPEIEITANGGEVVFYEILADEVVNLKGGILYDLIWLRVLGTVGYGLPFGNYDAVYIDGFETDEHRRIANWMAVGGLELSVTVIFRINK